MTTIRSRGNRARRTTHDLAGLALVVAAACLGLPACGGSSRAPTTSSTAPTSIGPKKNATKALSGKISAERGSTWTITDKKGTQFTATITSRTKFGTNKQPATQEQFPIGTPVRVTGQIDGTSVTATRIQFKGGSTTPATTAPASPTSTG